VSRTTHCCRAVTLAAATWILSGAALADFSFDYRDLDFRPAEVPKK
jgi:hypothetical protein